LRQLSNEPEASAERYNRPLHNEPELLTLAKKSFKCKLVTPLAALLNDSVTYASVPAWDGLVGFLPGRAAFLGRLGLGELRLDVADSDKGPGGTRSFLIDGGFIRMANDQMTILADRAVPAETIAPSDAEAEMKAAEAVKDPTARTRALNRAKKMMQMAKTAGAKI